MLLSVIILAIFFVVTSRKTFMRCLKLQKADPIYLRRDSILIGMLQQDMLNQIHSLVMLPIFINNANQYGPAMIPMVKQRLSVPLLYRNYEIKVKAHGSQELGFKRSQVNCFPDLTSLRKFGEFLKAKSLV